VDRRQNELEEHKRRRLGILSVELRWDGSHDRTAESRRRSAVPRHYRLPGARVQWATRRVARVDCRIASGGELGLASGRTEWL
jgi:hypothetical protein